MSWVLLIKVTHTCTLFYCVLKKQIHNQSNTHTAHKCKKLYLHFQWLCDHVIVNHVTRVTAVWTYFHKSSLEHHGRPHIILWMQHYDARDDWMPASGLPHSPGLRGDCTMLIKADKPTHAAATTSRLCK